MRFATDEEARAVYLGKKTQHRILVKKGRAGAPRQRLRIEVGQAVDLRGPSGPVGQQGVKDVRIERLGDMRDADARAEGVRNLIQWRERWIHRYDIRWVRKQLERDGVDLDIPGVLNWDVEMRERWDQHWASKEVHVVEFRHHDPTWYLTPAAEPAGSEKGYTLVPGRGMRGEPPAVDGPTAEEFADAAKERFNELRAEQRRRERVRRLRRAVTEETSEEVLDQVEELVLRRTANGS